MGLSRNSVEVRFGRRADPTFEEQLMTKLALTLLLLCTSVAAVAGDEAPLLSTPPFAAHALLPAPPAEDSATSREELAELHNLQAQRSAAELARAKADAAEENVFAFSTVLGPQFTAEQFPLTTRFFDRVTETEKAALREAKDYWHRRRPYVVDPTLAPCSNGSNGSYPSGHSTLAFMDAALLAQMLPERHDALFERAADFAHNRLVCGVHYPSDVEAGKTLGTVLAALLQREPALTAPMAAATSELRHAYAAAASR
jgi:acid phosphatase (class A)